MAAGRRQSAAGPGKPVTLHAVAARAGCSTATVSKALNGIAVSAANLERVRSAVEELGYVPNSAARSMRGSRTMTIGIVMNMDVHPGHELLSVLNSMISDMEALGYSVLLSVPQGPSVDLDVLLRRFIERRVDGLFLWNARAAKSLMWYRNAGVPVVAIGFRDEECAHLPLVGMESSAEYSRLFAHARSLGHRVVGEITGPYHYPAPNSHESLVTAQGMEWRGVRVVYEDEPVRDMIRSVVADPTGPTVLLAPYPVALQVLAACEAVGVRVPEQLSVVAATDSPGAPLLRTPLDAVRTDYVRLGHASVEAMQRYLAGEVPDDVMLHDCLTWIPRGSLGPVAQR